jgi:EAL domain-containing protein (putative c-di-GMP-specific phosphodiesterase class I)
LIRDVVDQWFRADMITQQFQPIFEIGAGASAMHSVEALTRGPEGTQFEDASVFFDYLRKLRQEVRADRRCVAAAIRRAARAGAPRLSLNVHPTTLERDENFPSLLFAVLDEHAYDPARVSIEIIEESRYWSTSALMGSIRALRERGVTIALDDVGVGRCNYRAILDVRPDLLKIDRYFVDGCSTDAARRAILTSVVSLASDLGATVIAEGVECEDDLHVVRETGIRYAQGFLLGRPAALEDVLARGRERKTDEPIHCPSATRRRERLLRRER